jgi:hypothetical protein
MGAAPIGRSHGRRTIEKRLSASFVGRPLFEVAETEGSEPTVQEWARLRPYLFKTAHQKRAGNPSNVP